MKSALIHGILLAVMLVYGYRTWTREKTATPAEGSVALWSKPESELVSIELTSPKKILKIERKPEGYWWGVDTTIELKPKAAGSGSAGSGSAGSAAPVEEEEVGRHTSEFPLGEGGETLIKSWTDAYALGELGTLSADKKKDYKLDDAKTTVTITFKDGPKTFVVGGTPYGGGDRYALDQASGKAYVFAKAMISDLEIGEPALHLTDPRGFEATKVASVTIEAGNRSKTVVRTEVEGEGGRKQKTWADADTKAPNQTAANFVDNAANLKPTEFAANLKPSDMTLILKLTYKSDNGAQLGTLALYRFDKPGELPPDAELDPANPPKGETVYYIVTEKTHVPGLVRKDTAQRMENDIDTVFSGKPADAGAGSGSGHSAVNPHGNPFGTGSLPKVGAGSAALAPKPPVPTAPAGSAAVAPKPAAPAPAPKPAASGSPAAAGSAH